MTVRHAQKADPIRVILFFSSRFMRQEKEEPANEVSLCAELGHFRYLDWHNRFKVVNFSENEKSGQEMKKKNAI